MISFFSFVFFFFVYQKMSFDRILTCPATCELCGQWMPRHSVNYLLKITLLSIFSFILIRKTVLEVECILHNGLLTVSHLAFQPIIMTYMIMNHPSFYSLFYILLYLSPPTNRFVQINKYPNNFFFLFFI